MGVAQQPPGSWGALSRRARRWWHRNQSPSHQLAPDRQPRISSMWARTLILFKLQMFGRFQLQANLNHCIRLTHPQGSLPMSRNIRFWTFTRREETWGVEIGHVSLSNQRRDCSVRWLSGFSSWSSKVPWAMQMWGPGGLELGRGHKISRWWRRHGSQIRLIPGLGPLLWHNVATLGPRCVPGSTLPVLQSPGLCRHWPRPPVPIGSDQAGSPAPIASSVSSVVSFQDLQGEISKRGALDTAGNWGRLGSWCRDPPIPPLPLRLAVLLLHVQQDDWNDLTKASFLLWVLMWALVPAHL